jgi:hypothetical protein
MDLRVHLRQRLVHAARVDWRPSPIRSGAAVWSAQRRRPDQAEMQLAVIPPSAGTATIGIRASRCAVRVRSSYGGHSPNWDGCLVVRESRTVESNRLQWILAPLWLPHCSSQSVKRSRSSVKVTNTRTGFSSRLGGTATNSAKTSSFPLCPGHRAVPHAIAGLQCRKAVAREGRTGDCPPDPDCPTWWW